MSTQANSHTPAVLSCWKDIATYMGKGVRTVQRWERDFGLPVRRPAGSQKKAVIARRSDLDAWVATRCSVRNAQSPADADRACVQSLASLTDQLRASRTLHQDSRALVAEINEALCRLRQSLGFSVHLTREPGPSAEQTAPGGTRQTA